MVKTKEGPCYNADKVERMHKYTKWNDRRGNKYLHSGNFKKQTEDVCVNKF